MMAARVLLGVLAFLAAQQLSTCTSEQLGREELMNKVLWAERRNKHCKPGWADSYTELHKKMLANPSSKKLVAIPNISGLADRIIGIATLALVAMLTDRAFQIGYRQPLIPLETVFTSPNINWQRPKDDDWLLQPLRHDAAQRNYNSSVLESKEYFAVNTIDDWKLQDKFLRQKLQSILTEDAQTVMTVLNRGKTIRIFENKYHSQQLQAYGLTPQTAFGCLVHYLFQPKPDIFTHLQEITQQVTETARDSSTLLIGIQIRAGDNYLTRQDHSIDVQQYAAFFDCAQQIEQWALPQTGATTAKWFLVSDSTHLRSQAVARFGKDKVITAGSISVEHSAKETSVCKSGSCDVSSEGFQVAAAEWWLFSFARFHVISQYSGYGRSAAMLSFSENSIYTVPHKQQAKRIECSAKSFTELGDLPYEWSGI